MFNVQEQEERDYQLGAADELTNAYRQSQRERGGDDSAQIEALTNEGKFVVVLETTDYCPRTDAILGGRRTLHSTHNTFTEAQKALPEGDEDAYFVVVGPKSHVEPKAAPVAPVEHVYDGGELPF